MERVYLDYAATTPIRPEVRNVMEPYLTNVYFNPSAIYSSAQRSKNAIETARHTVADLLKAKPSEIYFTSGGTESNNWALFGMYLSNKYTKYKLITSQYEHHSILKSAEFIENMGGSVNYLHILSNGSVDTKELERLIDNDTDLVSVMYVNNEIGSINPVNEISDICRFNNVPLHTDAVAAAGHLDIDAKKFDLLSISAHKFGGPKGAGILYINEKIKIKPIMCGGEQERGKRAGTENVASIVGCAKAFEIACREMNDEYERIEKLRNIFEDSLKEAIPNIKINNDMTNRLPNYLNISLPGINSQTSIIALDLKGIECSNGSACMAGGSQPSHVLKSMNLPKEQIENALRFTIDKNTTLEQIEYTVKTVKELCYS